MTNLCTRLVSPCYPGSSGLQDFFVPTFGELVATLRAQRGLTQDELGRRVGVDRNTIARTEQDKGTWYPRTSLAIFEALCRVLPMRPEEAQRFLSETDLDPALARPPLVRYHIEQDIAAEEAGQPVPSDQTSVEMRDVHRALSRLLDALGPATTKTVLEAAADSADASRAQQTPRQVTVVDPPKVPFPGAVEQVHRTYEVHSKPAPKPKAKPKKRTG